MRPGKVVKSSGTAAGGKGVLYSIKDELRDIILNERSNPPGLSIEEITETKAFDTHDSGLGFTWYLEDE